MNRRQSLVYLSAIAGHALFSEVVAAFARSSAAIAQAPASWQPVLVSPARAYVTRRSPHYAYYPEDIVVQGDGGRHWRW